MFLKTLQIKGFKSFADPADLNLEPGVTVVVGPNGSGKSNVVDAIGWVLGAQKPSTVRSGKMEDVIFAGTSKRAALGRAEVSLTIDNSAGMLPIDFTEVTITRLLFRNGDSEYSINGVPCRLLDIQELLSDSGVGRHQHVIISQGNIDAVLNARAEDRRLIIEEAAGVLKFRRRKERSERRLAATEANLTRVQDLLREVRRQLRPLERQADAARRHGDLVGELHALRVFLVGRELATLRNRLAASTTKQTELRRSDQELRVTLSQLDTQIIDAEANLASLGGRDVGDALVRYEKLAEKARGLAALLAERERGISRELGSSVDEGVIASLEDDASRLRAEMAGIIEDEALLAASTEELRSAESRLAAMRVDFETEWGDGFAPVSGEASAVRSELETLRSAIDRTRVDEERLATRRAALAERIERLGAELDRATTEAAEVEASIGGLIDGVDVSVSRRGEAERLVATAEDGVTTAEAEYSAWSARAEALGLALDEARQRAGAEHLADLDGVLGTLLDVVEIDDGWQDAFEAAAGDALDAVIVRDADVGERALTALESGDHRGAVLVLRGNHGVLRPAATDGTPLRSHVRALDDVADPTRRGAVEQILDQLLSGVVVVDGDWRVGLDFVRRNPQALVVSRAGDRFSASGWRLGSSGSGVTGAALEEAVRRTEEADHRREEARSEMGRARSVLAEARDAENAAVRERDAAESSRRSLSQLVVRLGNDASEADGELASLVGHLSDLEERLAREQARVTELGALLPELEAAEAERDERVQQMARAREELETRAGVVSAQRTDLEVRSAALEERRRFVGGRLEQIEERLAHNIAERETAAARRIELEARSAVTVRLAQFIASRTTVIDANLGALRDEQRRQSDAARTVLGRLEGLREERAISDKTLEEIRAQIQQAEIEDAETRLRLETAVSTIRGELDSEPDAAIAAECPPLPEGTSASARVRELERELRLMGPINPLALTEFVELSERHKFLEEQLEDIRSTRRELNRVIRAVEAEIVNVFSAAYADVSANFTQLFESLFPGGEGKLRLTEPNNLLETGLEIEARPSGKNVRKLSLLSGGERSLTALAFLFAVFRSRPSPFYVMDEVEAALDDVNLHRFLGLIAEFRETAQLIIVSHQKRTMEAADVLYGVTMEPGGSSKVVSERASSIF